MVWSKELAQLKQDLKLPDGNQSAILPAAPKPSPAPVKPKPLHEEDALFLAALGVHGVSNPKQNESPKEGGEFEVAMSQLKGIRQKNKDIPILSDSKEVPEGETETQHIIPEENINIEQPHPSDALPGEFLEDDISDKKNITLPEKIQLAAGMTIDVDGQLDLRNHNAVDARERLKERVLDGFYLGWRSLHIILGNSEPLQEAFADYISSPQQGPIAKYAQAPVPMGGTKAWILYYETQAK